MVFNLLESLQPTKMATGLKTEQAGAITDYLKKVLDNEPPAKAFKSMEASYPLSPIQLGMLFHGLLEPQSGADIEQIVCTLQEDLDVKSLIQAWETVVAQHPILRTSFKWDGLDQPLQEVYQNVPLPLAQHDWRNLSPIEQCDRHISHLQADRQRGFDLTYAPLMRLALFRLADAEYRLIWTFHHILLDGRSFVLLLQEIFDCYQAIRQGQGVSLPTSRPYQDYIEWLQQQDSSKAKDFWQHLLKGFSTPTPLLTIQASSHLLERGEHGAEEIRLSTVLTTALQSLAKQHDITPNTLVQGAWALLLSRYSGEDDVVFGAIRACRRTTLEGTESMIGLLINTLPVRVQVPAEAPLLPWLKDLRSQHVAVRDYEHTPLLDVRGWSDVPSNIPLFESIVVFENYLLNTKLQQQGGDWLHRDFQLHEQPTFPLVLLACLDAELSLKISYDRSRFDQAAITRLLGHLQTLLTEMIAHPERSLAELAWVTEAERHQLLVAWNDTAAAYAQDVCLHELFEAQVQRNPGAIAVVYENQQLTYGDVNRYANQIAHHLKALGVGSGTFVGVYLNRGLEMIPALLGILKAGGAYVPLEPTFPAARVQWILDSLDVRWVITQPVHQTTFEALKPQLPQLEHLVCLDVAAIEAPADCTLNQRSQTGLHVWQQPHLAQQSQGNLSRQSSPDDTAYVIFTSGSTGTPKGVVVRHQPVINLIEWVNRTFNISPSDRVLFITSLCFDLSVYDIFGLLAAGGSIRVVSSEAVRNPTTLLKIICQEPITFWDSAPPALQQLAPFFSTVQGAEQQNQLRLVFMSGDWIPVTLPDAVKATFPGVEVISLGGATEATVWSNAYRIDRIDPQWTSIPYGKPILNAQYYVLDARLQPCPIGVTGELYIGGECLASGYTDPVKTAERFIPHPFNQAANARLYRTGDLARFFPDGNIEFLGRIDHQVKIRGFRIELGEIEAVLAQHEAIRVSVVMAREDQPGDKRLVAYIVPRQQPAPTMSELRRYLKEKLPEYMVPSAIVMLDELPITANGKLDRKALPTPEQVFADDRQALLASQTETGTSETAANSFVAPRDELERQLTEIWQNVLNVKPIGIHDNFFDLGGHSLSAVRVWSQVEKLFGKNLPITTLLQAPTVKEMANILRDAETDTIVGDLVPLRPGGHKPPLFCIYGILLYRDFVDQLDVDQPVYGVYLQEEVDLLKPGITKELAATFSSVPKIAARYLKAIRTLRPHGPYYLAGASFGGVVAFEMAQQLRDEGEEVALVGLLDSWAPNSEVKIPFIQRLMLHHQLLLKRGLPYLWHSLQKSLEELQLQAKVRLYKICQRLSLEGHMPQLWSEAVSQVLLGGIRHQAIQSYLPKPYAGQLVLFRAVERDEFKEDNRNMGWAALTTGDLQIFDVPGDHLGILKEPNVQVLAGQLQTYLSALRGSLGGRLGN